MGDLHKETVMAAKLDYRSRRTPSLSLVLILISLAICLVFSSLFSVISLFKDTLGSQFTEYGYKFGPKDMECSILYSTLQNTLIYSSFFVFIILMMMLFKPKTWAYSIPAFLAGGFNLIIGIPMFANGVKSYFLWFLGIEKFGQIFKYGDLSFIESIKRIFTLTIDFLKDCIPAIERPTENADVTCLTTYILLALPLAAAFCWFALAIAAITAFVSGKVKKTAVKLPLGIGSAVFGILSSGVFVISAFSNFIGLINCFFDTNVFPFLLNYDMLYFEGTRYIMMLIAPVMFIGNVLGAIGMIVFSIYMVKPNKKGYIPEYEEDLDEAYDDEYIPEEFEGTDADPKVVNGEAVATAGVGATATVNTGLLPEDVAAAEEAKRVAAYRAARVDEAHRAEVYRQEMRRARAQREAERQDAIRRQAASKVRSRWSPVFTFAFITLLISLIFEPAALIPFIGVISVIVMLCAKRKAPLIIMGILNILFGLGIICIISGILMFCIPEDTLV